jgi:hypothetical protein
VTVDAPLLDMCFPHLNEVAGRDVDKPATSHAVNQTVR